MHLRDCRILPHPERRLPLVCAGQSDAVRLLTAQNADYAFVTGDLSRDPLPTAEAYAMGCVLHDWDLDTQRWLIN